MTKLRDIVLTYRLYIMPVVYVTIIYGYLVANNGITWSNYLILGLVSLSAHILGFGINDLMDLKYDKENPRHLRRSLFVRGELSLNWHIIITLVQIPILLVWAIILKVSNETFIVAAISIAAVMVYNILGKRSGVFVVLIDLFFPVSMALLFLAGFSLSAPLSELTTPVILLLACSFLGFMLGNSVLAGFRDINSDLDQGASNFLGALGSKSKNLQIYLSPTARAVSHVVYLLNIPLVFYMAYLNSSAWWAYVIASILLFYGYVHLFILLRLKSNRHLVITDYYVSMAIVFYATLLPWISYLPNIIWALIGFNLIYPLIVNKEGHFGRSSFGIFFREIKQKY